MSTDIKGIGDSVAQISELAASQRKPEQAPGSATAGSPERPARTDDAVSFTETATRLRALEDSLASTPVVDAQRVQGIRQELADGNYEVDHQRVAEKMIHLEGLLDEVGDGSGS